MSAPMKVGSTEPAPEGGAPPQLVPVATPGILPPPPPNYFPVPPPWTEHRAPAGQPYWFNPITNVSTYVRPAPILPAPPPHFLPPPGQIPFAGPPIHLDPNVGSRPTSIGLATDDDQGKKEKKQKKEKPKTKIPIEGTEWIEVTTNLGNVFWNHRESKKSVWTCPEEVKKVKQEKDREERERLRFEQEEEKNKKRKIEEEKEEEQPKEEKGTSEKDGSPMGESESPTATTKEDAEPPTKKKKKSKVVVIHDIEELEQDEDWQRQIAAEMAEEAEEIQREEQQRVVDEVGRDVRNTNGSALKAEAPLGGMNVSPEEAAALFKAMLSEKDIAPMAPWDMELPKFINDSRYLAVKQLKDRRDLFEEFCKEKLREIRAAKKKAAEEGSLPQVDPLTAYRTLLEKEVSSTRTHYSDFKRQHHKDPRFRNFGKTEGEKEKVFKQWLRDLGERKRAEAIKAETNFKLMLAEDKSLKDGMKWTDVKARFATDPRYNAVPSSSQREGLFTSHIKSLSNGGSNGATTSSATASTSAKPAPSKEERAARAAASLKEREEQVRGDKDRAARQARAAKGQLGREEGEREFGTLLVDQVRDHTARWEDVLPYLSKDSRFIDSPLPIHDQRRMFESHLRSLYEKRLSAVEALFAQHAPLLTTRFETVLPSIFESPHVTRLVEKDFDCLEQLYDSWLRKRSDQARQEFDELLKESPILEHWGRLAKQEDKDKIKVMGEEGAEEDSDDDDEMPSLVEMAKQIDLPAIEKVLKIDKRYLIFDHVPEKRREWIEEYLKNLSAPKQTVHQKE